MLGSVMPWLAMAQLHWNAPAGCPSQAEAQERLQELLGSQVLRSDVVADARVQTHDGQWTLRLALHAHGRSTTRTMTSDDCQTLADAVALVVATFADPLELPARVDDRARPIPVQPESPELPEPIEPGFLEPADPRPSPSSIGVLSEPPLPPSPSGWGVRLGVVAGHATQPDLDLGPVVTLSRRWAIARVAVGLVGLIPRDQAVPDREGVELRRWMLAGRLAAGVTMPLTARVEIPLGIGIELGPVIARGQRITQPRTVVSPWLAAIGSASVTWHTSPRVSLWAGAEGLFGLLIPRFTVDGAGPLASGPSGLRAMLGVEWRWGADFAG